jgi:UTP--glucose-1-phosphate uridylyltransferase
MNPSRRIRMALFPVAGLGTRFLPATKALPKEMLPIVDKPLIQYAVEEAVAAGIEHIVLVTHRAKRAIEDHFDASLELDRLLELQGKHALLYELRATFPSRFSLTCVRQNQPHGLGNALLCARHLVGDEPFAVLLADDLMQARRPVLAQMIQQYHRLGGNIVAVEQIARENAPQYGVVDARPVGERIDRVTSIVDRPRPEQSPSLSGVVGRYVLSPAIFDALAEASPEAGQELQLIEGIQRLLAQEPVFAYRFEGRRFDCGSKLGFLEATVNFGLKHPEVGEAFAKLLGRRARTPGTHARRVPASAPAPAPATPAVPS